MVHLSFCCCNLMTISWRFYLFQQEQHTQQYSAPFLLLLRPYPFGRSGGKLQLQLAQVVRARKTIFPSAMFDRDRPHHAITIKSRYLCENVILEKIGKLQVDFISVDFVRKIGKRQKSREKEKNLEKEKTFRKKENFFRRDFFQRKFSFSLFVHF